jgi:exosortase/archaeosortase family protein
MAVTPVTPDDLESTPGVAPARRRGWVTRGVSAAALVGGAVALVLLNQQARQLEAELAAWVAAHTFADGAATGFISGSPMFAFGVDGEWRALRITTECAISFVIAPFLVMFAAITLIQRFRPLRIAIAVSLSVILFVLLNQIRFLVIAIAFVNGGHQGYSIAHSLVGSIIMFVGIAAMVVMSLFVVAGRRRVVRPRRH